LTLTTQHSDAALMQLGIPWQTLLSGVSAPEEVRMVRLPLAVFYRGQGQPIAVALDVTDGLNRAQEAPELVAAGRSITEPEIHPARRPGARVDALGLSSYPYLGGFSEPDLIPLDYYSRLVEDAPLPELVLEGGWPSVAAGSVASTPGLQARYIRRQAALLERAGAVAVFQITLTDLDLSASPPPPGSVLPLFAHLGLVDSAFAAKPALAVWDSLLALDHR
jgi:hypothetical protein